MTIHRKFSILVIDDDSKIRELVQAFFAMKNADINCVMAADVQQAVLKMSNQEFDLLLIDNVMPGRTGIDYAIFLRKSIKYSNLPIVLMSGALQKEDAIKAIESGIKEILVKPFNLKELNEKIMSCLKKQ